jgi:WD40-like Beta Propeller Repeat
MSSQKVRPDLEPLDWHDQHQRGSRNRRRAGGYVLLALVLIAGTAIGVVATMQRDQRPAGNSEFGAGSDLLLYHPYLLDLQTGDRTPLPLNLPDDHSETGLLSEIDAYVPSPDGTRLAYSSGCGFADAVSIINIDGTNLEKLPGTTNCGVRWSSDGTKLVYQHKAMGPCCPQRNTGNRVENLFVYDLSTGQNTQITDLELERAHWWYLAPTFTVDGQNVLFHLPRSSSEATKWDIWSVPVAGGDPTLVQRDASFPMANPQPEPHPGPSIGPSLEMQFVSPLANDPAGRGLMTGPGSDPDAELVGAIEAIRWPTVSPDGSRIAYQDGGSIYVVLLPRMGIDCCDVTKVAEGSTAEWLANDTLVVTP